MTTSPQLSAVKTNAARVPPASLESRSVRRARIAIGLAVVTLQLAWGIYAQWQPWRYFAWAPNDYATTYSVAVRIAGRSLDANAICARYRKEFCSNESPDPGRTEFFDEGPPQHLIDQIEQYERTYGSDDRAVVEMRYSVDGHPEEVWRFP
jgi:hypothetical protein